MQEILVIVRTWLYQAALDPVVAEEASLSRPLSPAQAPRKGREWILAARRPEEPDRVAGGTPASQYAGAQQPMSACVTVVSRAHPVVRALEHRQIIAIRRTRRLETSRQRKRPAPRPATWPRVPRSRTGPVRVV